MYDLAKNPDGTDIHPLLSISVKSRGPSYLNPLFPPPCWCPWDLLRSVQMQKTERGAESNGTLPHLFNPWVIAALVPEFAVEDLPSAELQL